MGVEITVKAKVGHRGSLEDLEAFIQQSREHGLAGFTWNASQGNMREPSELTLISTKES